MKTRNSRRNNSFTVLSVLVKADFILALPVPDCFHTSRISTIRYDKDTIKAIGSMTIR